jgi:uncharacterized protein YhaN
LAAISKKEQVDQNLQQALSRIDTSEAVSRTLREQVTRMEGNHRELQRVSNERQAKVWLSPTILLHCTNYIIPG